jgi:hypothetical protein
MRWAKGFAGDNWVGFEMSADVRLVPALRLRLSLDTAGRSRWARC